MEYDCFIRCYLDQEALVSEALHTRALTELFHKCPKLTDVVIRPGCGLYEHKPWSETSYVNSWFCSGINNAAAVRDVMRAAHNARILLRRIAVHFVDYRSSQFSARDLELIAATFHGTKCLSFRFRDWYDEPQPKVSSSLGLLLCGSQGLTHLSIGVGSGNQLLSRELGHMFEDRFFPHLSTIGLSAISLEKDHLHTFLITHKETLRVVKFTDLKFVGEEDSWSQFFTDVSQQLPNVRRFMLHGYHSHRWPTANDWEFGKQRHGFSTLKTHAMDKFIRKGGVLPATDDDCRKHVPDVKCVLTTSRHRKCVCRIHDSGQGADKLHIEEPDTDTEYYEDEEDEDLSFWKTHAW